jgi:hypothetical protein
MPRKLTHIQLCKKCLVQRYGGRKEISLLHAMLNHQLRSVFWHNNYLANIANLPWCQEKECHCILEHTILSQKENTQ